MEETDLLTMEDVAKIARVSVRTVREWRKLGTGPKGFRLAGSQVRYLRSDVDQWVIDSRTCEHGESTA